MEEYPKLKTLYKLQPTIEGKKKWGCSDGEILPETAALHHFPIEELIFTEKIDGTNMGIEVIHGRVNKVIKRHGDACLRGSNDDKFYLEKADELTDRFLEVPMGHMTFFGELCGPKIQHGGNYFSKRQFVCFDIYDHVEDKFFRWKAVEHFCNELGIPTAPVIEYPYETLESKYVAEYILNLYSKFNPKFPAEGMVVRHQDDTATTRRFMAKIRKRDFA